MCTIANKIENNNNFENEIFVICLQHIHSDLMTV